MQVFFHPILFWVQGLRVCECSSSMALSQISFHTNKPSQRKRHYMQVNVQCQPCTASRSMLNVNHRVLPMLIMLKFAFANTSVQSLLTYFKCCYLSLSSPVVSITAFQRNCVSLNYVNSQMNNMEQYIFAVCRVKILIVCSEQTR